MRNSCIVFVAVLFAFTTASAQVRTVGVFKTDSLASVGYTLIAPISSKKSFLIDNCGRKVHEWTSKYTPAFSAHLTDDGSLLRTTRIGTSPIHGGAGGGVELIGWEGNVVWSYVVSDSLQNMHHDVHMMPNGNVLIIVAVAVPRSTVVGAGRDSARLLSDMWIDKIQEIKPVGATGGEVVWEWFAWDHIVQDRIPGKPNYGQISEHPEKLDINYHTDAGGVQFRDWTHMNSVDYNAATDQILVSVRTFDELWVIDHSTTTAQAKTSSGGRYGKGGDILYRWGNPFAYKRGTLSTRTMYSPHCAKWVPSTLPGAGNISVFNNGSNRPDGLYSSVLEFKPPMDQTGNYELESGKAFEPGSPDWMYTAPTKTDFFTAVFGGAQRLQNGSTLITSGFFGEVFEVDPSGITHWFYINPVNGLGAISTIRPPADNMVYAAERYPASHRAFGDRLLTPKEPLELDPIEDGCIVDYPTTSVAERPDAEFKAGPYLIYDVMGRVCASGDFATSTPEQAIRNFPTGSYFLVTQKGKTLYLRR